LAGGMYATTESVSGFTSSSFPSNESDASSAISFPFSV
jgi:hypothetical protein